MACIFSYENGAALQTVMYAYMAALGLTPSAGPFLE